jgi:farnesyl-diphosphate farnesyltransferase
MPDVSTTNPNKKPDAATDPRRDELATFCERMLKGTSRTFALSIPELPAPLDEQVRCAYLICRIIDTLEDRPGVDENLRQYLFDAFIALLGPPVQIDALNDAFAIFSTDLSHLEDDPCAELMAQSHLVLQTLASFPDHAVAAIRDCAVEMTAGLRQTPLPPSNQPHCLFNTWHELERYCHYAAGVVGLMLARLFAAHTGRDPNSLTRRERHNAKRFGRGLQITNITKDHPSDLTDGRCFIPREAARAAGLTEADLLTPSLDIRIRAQAVRRAAAHLDIALEFCLSLPPDPVGLRVFCVQPMMMALLTLERVGAHHDPTPDDRPKITRDQVKSVLETSHRVSADNAALKAWYTETRSALAQPPPH